MTFFFGIWNVLASPTTALPYIWLSPKLHKRSEAWRIAVGTGYDPEGQSTLNYTTAVAKQAAKIFFALLLDLYETNCSMVKNGDITHFFLHHRHSVISADGGQNEGPRRQ